MNRALLPILREIGDLKRITSAGRPGSVASRAFAVGWDLLSQGRPATDVALDVTGACLLATRLGDLDGDTLTTLGLSPGEIETVRRQAFEDLRNSAVRGALLDAMTGRCPRLPSLANPAQVPPFVEKLAAQPRAGATCPGKARVVLGPSENHAEHCLVVAVYAVLLSEPEADLGTTFVAALSHHLHNAMMPDAGYTGEMLLGRHLGPVMENATRAAMAELPAALAASVEAARAILPDASTAEGRAFHAADVLDRVLEIEQHLARSRVTMDEILGDMALVHEGPVKPFHDSVLAAMGVG